MRLFDAGSRASGPGQVHRRVLTAANTITAARLLGLPLFAWLVLARRAYWPAFAVLAVIAATDWLDGYVARRFDQVSRLGQVMDPLVDRLLLATAAITLMAVSILPWWVVALIVGRDALLLAGSLILFRGLPPIPVSRAGKLGTALLFIGIPAFVLRQVEWSGAQALGAAAWAFTIGGLAVYYVAAALYLAQARSAVRERDASEAVQRSHGEGPGTGSPASR